ncbi:MAG: hypothetical protein ABIA04_09345 [Pseudomonadota bacterium]
MKKLISLSYFIFILLALNLYPLYINTEFISQLRSDETSKFNIPLRQYLFLESTNYEGFLNTKLDLDVYGDPALGDYSFNLYNSSLELSKLLNQISVKLGRISQADTFEYKTFDGVLLDYKPNKNIEFNFFTGVKRFVEEDNFENGNFVLGTRFIINRLDNLSSSFQYEFENDLNGEFTNTFALASDYQFMIYSFPNFYFNSIYEVSNNTLENLSGGIEFLPLDNLKLDVGVGRYDLSKQGLDADSILSFFADGPIVEAFASADFSPFSFITLFEEVSFSQYDYFENVSTDGYNLESGVCFPRLIDKFTTTLSYFYLNSYGGTGHGANIIESAELLQNLSFNLIVSLIDYEKITSESGISLATHSWLNLKFTKNMNLKLYFEYNSNDEINHDYRAGFALNYVYF